MKYLVRDGENNVISLDWDECTIVEWPQRDIQLESAITITPAPDPNYHSLQLGAYLGYKTPARNVLGTLGTPRVNSIDALALMEYYLQRSGIARTQKAYKDLMKLKELTPTYCRVPTIYDWKVTRVEDLKDIDYSYYCSSLFNERHIKDFENLISQFQNQVNKYYSAYQKFAKYMHSHHPDIEFIVDSENYEIDWNYLAHYFILPESESEQLDYWAEHVKKHGLESNLFAVNLFSTSLAKIEHLAQFNSLDESYVMLHVNPDTLELHLVAIEKMKKGALSLTQNSKEINYLFTTNRIPTSLLINQASQELVEGLFTAHYKKGNLWAIEPLHIDYNALYQGEAWGSTIEQIKTTKEQINIQLQSLLLNERLASGVSGTPNKRALKI